MVKLCIEHGIADIKWIYCPTCGRKLWGITDDEFKKAWDFGDTEEGKRDYINYLKERHPEFRFIPYTDK